MSAERAAMRKRAGRAPATHWQELAASYDAIMGQEPTMRVLRELILAQLPPSPSSVLDLGTGTGALLQLIRCVHPGCRLTGLDPAVAMLEEVRKKFGPDPGVRLICGSGHDIEAADESFDVVVSNFALHHLPHDDKRRCAREIFRVLKAGGRLIFGDQHCCRMGSPRDPEWVGEMLDLFSSKARYYLATSGMERMLLQVRLMPRLLTADGEIPATVEFWLECLAAAGFAAPEVLVAEPAFLLHRVIVAARPGASGRPEPSGAGGAAGLKSAGRR